MPDLALQAFDKPAHFPHHETVGWLDGRWQSLRTAGGKSGLHGNRVLGNPQRGQLKTLIQGKVPQKRYRPNGRLDIGVRVKWCGKSAPPIG